MEIKTAIILCAGFGKRLRPFTEKLPKPLIKIKKNLLFIGILKRSERQVSRI